MADQAFEITSGFYDSVDDDRLYSADQMNMPYKRLISNGVFATPDGTPSNDFQVTADGSGLTVTVFGGNAIAGDKWVESETSIPITVTANTLLVPRVDSVILQVDRTRPVRAASVIYRQGVASSNPQPPEITQTVDVYELRLANVTVEGRSTAITQINITDMRGSADCPWITSLIQQVDTSELFEQYRAAYQSELERYKDQWDAFFETLTEDLSVSSSTVTQTGAYKTTAASEANILFTALGISDFDVQTDTLMVYINGLFAPNGTMWTYLLDGSGQATGIKLLHPMTETDQSVFVMAFKPVLTGDMATAASLVGSPLVATTAADMIERNKIYVYTGSESGYTYGNWYYWNGSAWTSGGVYNSIAVNPIPKATVEAMFEEE